MVQPDKRKRYERDGAGMIAEGPRRAVLWWGMYLGGCREVKSRTNKEDAT
jgi:hypothetical protein